MRNRLLVPLALLAALAAPRGASADVSPNSSWSITVSAWGGVTRYDVLGLRSNLEGVGEQDGRDLLDGNFDVYGGAAVLRLGWLNLGALYEGARIESRTDSAVITPLVGFAVNLTDSLRFDLNGELGGHRVSNIGADYDVAQAETVWLPYVGIRPSLSLRLPLGFTRLVLSATPFARWDLVRREVTITVADGTASGTARSYDVGGNTFGLVGGIGLEI